MGVPIPVFICWQLRNGTQARRLAIVVRGKGGGAVGVVRLVASVVGVNAVGAEIVARGIEVVRGDGLRLKIGAGGLGFESEDFAECLGASHGCRAGYTYV